VVTLFAEHDAARSVRQTRLAEELQFYLRLPEQHPGVVEQIVDAEGLRRLESHFRNGEEVWGFVLAMEGADLLDRPEELAGLQAKGLRMLSLTWNERNQWACGANHSGGLQPAGRELLQAMRELGIILDVSHLNRRSFEEVLAEWDGPICASHSNPAALCGHHRCLTDDQLTALAERGGVVGALLYNGFLVEAWREGDPLVPLAVAGEHIHYLLSALGEDGVGIGSDFDGGLTARNTPQGLDSVADLPKLTEVLAARGWGPAVIRKVMGANWLRFLSENLGWSASRPPGGALSPPARNPSR